MDELHGPNIQIVLNLKEGLGFGFLNRPFLIRSTLNRNVLDTDAVNSCHAPIFNEELIWEADKRKFRRLRLQNIPLKIEVFAADNFKDRVGYVLLSLLGALPCPSGKAIAVRYEWHKLLGVKAEGKCCHPQLLVGLTIEDRINPTTPRRGPVFLPKTNSALWINTSSDCNPTLKLSQIHSHCFGSQKGPTDRLKAITNDDLVPRLFSDDGYIQIGDETKHKDTFRLSFIIGAVENINMLFPNIEHNEHIYCAISFSVFTYTIQTDRIAIAGATVKENVPIHVNQKTNVRLKSSLAILSQYFTENPNVEIKLSTDVKLIGETVLNLSKLLLNENINDFLSRADCLNGVISMNEHCLFTCYETEGSEHSESTRPSVHVELTLQYLPSDEIGHSGQMKSPAPLTSRSITQIDTRAAESRSNIAFKSTSCGDLSCDNSEDAKGENNMSAKLADEKSCSKCASQAEIQRQERVATLISLQEKEDLLRSMAEELVDWKEKQQEMFNSHLKKCEEHHLELLSQEWNKRKDELESTLKKGIDRCQELALNLSKATEDYAMQCSRNMEREKMLLDLKQSLESLYAIKYEELGEASAKLQEDYRVNLSMMEMRCKERLNKIEHLERENAYLKDKVKSVVKKIDSEKADFTKDQMASLIQELRYLEEKLETAMQSKEFFKEQWGRAVRELHATRHLSRTQMISRLQRDRHLLDKLYTIDEMMGDHELNQTNLKKDQIDLEKLKCEENINRLSLDSSLVKLQNAIDGELPSLLLKDMRNVENMTERPKRFKESINEKLIFLIEQRDELVQSTDPDEKKISQMNQEIRNLLITWGRVATNLNSL